MLVLTERTEHLDAIHSALAARVPPPFVLHGRMSKKQRAALIAGIDALAPQAPRILQATGKLVGEGFGHPALDAWVLGMPVSSLRSNESVRLMNDKTMTGNAPLPSEPAHTPTMAQCQRVIF